MGSKDAGLQLCEALCGLLPPGKLAAILCPDDTGDPRSRLRAFRQLAERFGIPLHVTGTKADSQQWIAYYDARIAFVHGWYQIIPVDGRCAFYGFHYSPLPKYRGNAPLVWQIINGETQIGVSFFRFSEGMDEGRLVGQAMTPLTEEETIADALDKANTMMMDLAARYVPALVEGEIVLSPQPDLEPSYCGLRLPEDGRVDWRQPAKRVHDFIRAQSRPYPGAFTVASDGARIRLWSSSIDLRTVYGVPGSVIDVGESDVTVACSVGAVRLQFVSGEDTSINVKAAEVIRSLRTRFL
nr:formyltransferase family protein [uncultured Pseudomonas sp.]